MINKILKNSDERLIIVAPTRELASQIAKEAISFAKGSGIYVTTIVGGESMGRQISSLKKDNRLIVGTPGRITDLIKRKVLKTKDINNIVVDEVDRMLDMGFIRDIQSLFKVISTDKQSLFFSATHNSGVDRTVKQLIRNYETIKLSNNTANNSVAQSVIDYSSTQEKMQLLEELLQREEVKKAIIFVETKRYADRVKKSLFSNKHRVDVIHGDKRQNYRNRVISKFRDSRINYLVATNVAARGIDIDDITHVINLDEPQNYDEYIHRIGRTGRNGSTGVAYTFLQK
jgi:superfamily II DNA/RNA helicase